MKFRVLALIAAIFLAVPVFAVDTETPTDTPTSTPTRTPTVTNTPTRTPTNTLVPSCCSFNGTNAVGYGCTDSQIVSLHLDSLATCQSIADTYMVPGDDTALVYIDGVNCSTPGVGIGTTCGTPTPTALPATPAPCSSQHLSDVRYHNNRRISGAIERALIDGAGPGIRTYLTDSITISSTGATTVTITGINLAPVVFAGADTKVIPVHGKCTAANTRVVMKQTGSGVVNASYDWTVGP